MQTIRQGHRSKKKKKKQQPVRHNIICEVLGTGVGAGEAEQTPAPAMSPIGVWGGVPEALQLYHFEVPLIQLAVLPDD